MSYFINIHSSQIREITEKGISYLDDSGEDSFIDFEECYQNYLKSRLTFKAYEKHKELNPQTDLKTYEEYAKWCKNYRKIGIADPYLDGQIMSGNPYITFYTEPHTEISFESSTDCKTMKLRIMKISRRNYGWHIHDLS